MGRAWRAWRALGSSRRRPTTHGFPPASPVMVLRRWSSFKPGPKRLENRTKSNSSVPVSGNCAPTLGSLAALRSLARAYTTSRLPGTRVRRSLAILGRRKGSGLFKTSHEMLRSSTFEFYWNLYKTSQPKLKSTTRISGTQCSRCVNLQEAVYILQGYTAFANWLAIYFSIASLPRTPAQKLHRHPLRLSGGVASQPDIFFADIRLYDGCHFGLDSRSDSKTSRSSSRFTGLSYTNQLTTLPKNSTHRETPTDPTAFWVLCRVGGYPCSPRKHSRLG